MSDSIEEKFKQLLFEKYQVSKKHLIPKEEYFHILDAVKSAGSASTTKARKQYYQLSK